MLSSATDHTDVADGLHLLPRPNRLHWGLGFYMPIPSLFSSVQIVLSDRHIFKNLKEMHILTFRITFPYRLNRKQD